MTQIRLVCCHNWSLNLPDETGTAPRLLRLRSGYEEFHTMRVLIGIILGVILTVGGAYLYDSPQCGDSRERRQRAAADGQLGCGR